MLAGLIGLFQTSTLDLIRFQTNLTSLEPIPGTPTAYISKDSHGPDHPPNPHYDAVCFHSRPNNPPDPLQNRPCNYRPQAAATIHHSPNLDIMHTRHYLKPSHLPPATSYPPTIPKEYVPAADVSSRRNVATLKDSFRCHATTHGNRAPGPSPPLGTPAPW